MFRRQRCVQQMHRQRALPRMVPQRAKPACRCFAVIVKVVLSMLCGQGLVRIYFDDVCGTCSNLLSMNMFLRNLQCHEGLENTLVFKFALFSMGTSLVGQWLEIRF